MDAQSVDVKFTRPPYTQISKSAPEDRGLAEGGYKKVRNKSKSLAELSTKKVWDGRKLETFARFLPQKLNLDRFRNCERRRGKDGGGKEEREGGDRSHRFLVQGTSMVKFPLILTVLRPGSDSET